MPSLRKDLKNRGLPAVLLCRMDESGVDRLGGRHIDSEMSILTDSFPRGVMVVVKILTP